jgi:DNA-binding transcriptional LysR family regulator
MSDAGPPRRKRASRGEDCIRHQRKALIKFKFHINSQAGLMNITLRQLKAFTHTARLGSFTRAAEVLHITQAGLSIMMRELETQLDCRLFDRTTRSLSLTAAGESFLPVAARALAELEAAAAHLGEMSEKARQTLRIAATPLVSSNLLPTVCRAFRKRHPEVTIRILDTGLAQVSASVENGEADFGMGFFFEAQRGIERTALYAFQLMLVTPTGDGWEARHGIDGKPGVITWKALRDLPLVGLPPDNPIQGVVEHHLGPLGRANEERLTFNHVDTLIAMVAAGMGAAIVPSFAMVACRRQPVHTRALKSPAVPLNFYRISRRGREVAPAASAFTAMLIEALPGLIGEPARQAK